MVAPDILRAVSLLNQLTAPEITRMAESAHLRHFRSDEIITRAGESCQDLFILASGAVRIFKLSPDGREQDLEIARAGDILVGPPIFCGCSLAVAGQAQADTTLIVVPGDQLLRIIERYPNIAMRILASCCARMRRLTSLAAELSSKNVMRRLAWLLLGSCPCTHHSQRDGSYLMTEEEIATRLGSTQETISRALGQLRTRGIIQTRRQEVVVSDVAALRRIAAGSDARR